ncbi:MAG: class II D-tagatose-bisphosphate aldolase, non-catalytic subunit [Lentisphaerae bacterium]|jgi:D-tagatose-1,6-bisphosphate aldolase subunit GatZ/KbaZ|nr:class II D-tagatose-bisphosphate aldolase, non-catalytic subunit [Lentisphaerota bacterium]
MTTQHIPLRTLAAQLKQSAKACTLLGVGPVSEVVVRATFQACVKYRCPPIFIASRNQVDLLELGHGYLMGGMDQRAFVSLLREIAGQTGYQGPLYICRDHGGPWQRNVELDEKYPVAQAMEIARRSFTADIEAGFNYLHIDPTKCPHPYSQEQLVQWTAELIAYCETTRRELGCPEIDYEVGTEDIQGGLTTPETYEAFLRQLTACLTQDKSPLPTCVVGQTGTLCKIDRNVGHFDASGTARLVKIAAKYGVGFKEHNGDYLSAASCRVHPELGVTGMNVAPEFGLVETDALLALADLESKLVREGWLPEAEASRLRALFIQQTFTSTPWKKWMTDEIKQLSPEHIRDDAALRLLIARVCGHYTYDEQAIKTARARLYANLDRFQMIEEPESKAANFVVARVQAAIEFYLRHFALQGINDCCADLRH